MDLRPGVDSIGHEYLLNSYNTILLYFVSFMASKYCDALLHGILYQKENYCSYKLAVQYW